MRSDQLPLVTLDLRHAGEVLAHPCQCGRPQCTLGRHVWQATLDMDPGPRAQNTDPKVRGSSAGDTPDRDPDPALHLEYRRLIGDAWHAARALNDFVARVRPDRILRNPPVLSSVEDWCRNHIDKIASCEPRYRGDLCRYCYEFKSTEGVLPPQSILLMRHRGERLTAKDITQALDNANPTKPKHGKKRKSKLNRKDQP